MHYHRYKDSLVRGTEPFYEREKQTRVPVGTASDMLAASANDVTSVGARAQHVHGWLVSEALVPPECRSCWTAQPAGQKRAFVCQASIFLPPSGDAFRALFS